MSFYLNDLIALTVCGISAFKDTTLRKIPNLIIIPAVFYAALIDAADPKRVDPLSACFMAAFITILLIAFIKGAAGGGDLKLYTFICLIYPDKEGLYVIALSVITAFISIIILSFARRLGEGLPMAVFVLLGAAFNIVFGS